MVVNRWVQTLLKYVSESIEAQLEKTQEPNKQPLNTYELEENSEPYKNLKPANR